MKNKCVQITYNLITENSDKTDVIQELRDVYVESQGKRSIALTDFLNDCEMKVLK